MSKTDLVNHPTDILLPTSITDFLSRIIVVMVNTTLPANIGSAARAMHTMGLSQLIVVEPKLPIDADAIAHAAGAAVILEQVEIVPTLTDAIYDCQWVLAASSRKRTLPQLVMTPRQASMVMLEQFLQQKKVEANTDFKIALVFGREDRGLTNEELQLADYHIQIPANPSYGVLNVAASVQVIASVFFETALEKLNSDELAHHFSDLAIEDSNLPLPVISSTLSSVKSTDINKQIAHTIRQAWDEPAISHTQKLQLQTKILQLLEQVELYHPNEPKMLPHRLARLTQRLQLDIKEYELLQSLIAKLHKKIN